MWGSVTHTRWIFIFNPEIWSSERSTHVHLLMTIEFSRRVNVTDGSLRIIGSFSLNWCAISSPSDSLRSSTGSINRSLCHRMRACTDNGIVCGIVGIVGVGAGVILDRCLTDRPLTRRNAHRSVNLFATFNMIYVIHHVIP